MEHLFSALFPVQNAPILMKTVAGIKGVNAQLVGSVHPKLRPKTTTSCGFGYKGALWKVG
jgi:hypothetical protein